MMNEDKFNQLADIYEKYRPSYPQEYIKDIITKCHLNAESIVADIGAGTGILTRQFLQNNLKVIGVEPNADMRKILKKLEVNQKFRLVEGTAEHTNLEDNNIDLIVVAQAFHWFNKEEFKKECKRILKPNGSVWILWNQLDETKDIIKEQKRIDDQYTNRFQEVTGILNATKKEKTLQGFFKEDKYEKKVVDNPLENDKEKFIGSNLSKSYSLKKNDENYENYIEAFGKVFDKYSKNGKVIIPNKTYGYLGKIE